MFLGLRLISSEFPVSLGIFLSSTQMLLNLEVPKTHGGSQPSVTPVTGNPMPSSVLCGHQAHTGYTDTHVVKTPIYIK